MHTSSPLIHLNNHINTTMINTFKLPQCEILNAKMMTFEESDYEQTLVGIHKKLVLDESIRLSKTCKQKVDITFTKDIDDFMKNNDINEEL